ncbi:MAG: DUF3820 family protein [Bacteroidota bacterium]|nr:DUF3820 family protein [Bacteroidota bacterium]
MTDTDLMPFGKYKGTAMANVPDDYLMWFWKKNVREYNLGVLTGSWNKQLMAYIEDSFTDLPEG